MIILQYTMECPTSPHFSLATSHAFYVHAENYTIELVEYSMGYSKAVHVNTTPEQIITVDLSLQGTGNKNIMIIQAY